MKLKRETLSLMVTIPANKPRIVPCVRWTDELVYTSMGVYSRETGERHDAPASGWSVTYFTGKPQRQQSRALATL